MDFAWFVMPSHGFHRLPTDPTGCQLIPPVANRFHRLPTAANRENRGAHARSAALGNWWNRLETGGISWQPVAVEPHDRECTFYGSF
jgi:hypothetical protein